MEGTRVRLVSTTDEHTNLKAGDKGTVFMVDAIGTHHIKWDNGSNLGLVPDIDKWEAIPRIIITMEGGLINEIQADVKCEVIILDYDVESEDDERVATITDLAGDEEPAWVSWRDIEPQVKDVNHFYAQVEKWVKDKEA